MKSPTIPATVLPLIKNPPLLKKESRQEYYDLLGHLASEILPEDLIEWLWVIQFLDCSWELFRIRRFKVSGIDLEHYMVHRSSALESIDKLLDRVERRADKVVEQLEFRRELFAHKAKRAAEKLLNSKRIEVPRIAHNGTSPQTQSAEPTKTKQKTAGANESPVAPMTLEDILELAQNDCPAGADLVPAQKSEK